jgi:hypothetical protein
MSPQPKTITRKTRFLKRVISCQKHNLNPILAHYIYRISYKNAKKGKPDEMDLPLLKNDITGSEPSVKILDT